MSEMVDKYGLRTAKELQNLEECEKGKVIKSKRLIREKLLRTYFM